MENANLNLWRTRTKFVAVVDMVFLSLKWLYVLVFFVRLRESLPVSSEFGDKIVKEIVPSYTGSVIWQFAFAVILLFSTKPELEVDTARCRAKVYKFLSIFTILACSIVAISLFSDGHMSEDFVGLVLVALVTDAVLRTVFVLVVHQFIKHLESTPSTPSAPSGDACVAEYNV